jgi:type I restriction enzyme S subunit
MTGEARPYPEYKDSAVPSLGLIPAHWDVRRAKYQYREVDERSKTGTEVLCSVSHKTGVTPRKANVTMFMAESTVGYKICRPQDLVINTLWAWMAALGVASQIGVVSPAYGVYRPRTGSPLLPAFADMLLRIPQYMREYMARSTGVNASRLRLYPDRFLCIPIILPPSTDQEAIVRFLRDFDRRVGRFIRNRRRLIEVLNEQKQAIINRAVTRGLDATVRLKPSGIDWLGDIPQHWNVKRLKLLSKIIYGSSPHNSTYNVDGVGSVLVNGPDEYSREDFGFTRPLKWTTAPVKFAPAGALLFCLRGSTTGRLNVCHADVSIGRGVAALVPHGNNRHFAYAMMALRSHLKTTFRGSTFPSVTSSHLNNYWLPEPPSAEQGPIAQYIDDATASLNESIDRAMREIGHVREYRTRLIADVVTGKLDVRHLAPAEPPPADEPADADLGEAIDDDETPETDERELVEQTANE